VKEPRHTSLAARLGATSIKSKLTVFALLATLLPSAFLGYRFYDQNYSVLEAGIQQRLEASARDQAQELWRWIGRRQGELNSMATSYIGVELLPAAIAGNDAARLRIENYLLLTSGRLDQLQAAAVTDTVGRVIAASDDRAWALVDDWTAFPNVGTLPASPALRRTDGGGFEVMLASAILGPERQPLGLVVGRFSLERLYDQLAASERQADATVLVVDGEHRVIATGQRASKRLGDVLSNTLQGRLTPGQIAVFYDGDEVLGGGWICSNA